VLAQGEVIPPPPPEMISDYLEYEAERVIDHDPKRAIWSSGLATAIRITLGSQNSILKVLENQFRNTGRV